MGEDCASERRGKTYGEVRRGTGNKGGENAFCMREDGVRTAGDMLRGG